MAKRRNLKKNINYICSELFLEALVACKNPVCKASREEKNQLMASILLLQNDFISRISHTEPGSVRLFYKKLKEEFNQKADAIVDSIVKIQG